MTREQFFKNLEVPKGKIDVVLDTDAYNEVDDQYAISYMLKSDYKLNVRGICAAPFFNDKSTSPENGMERSYDEIMNLLTLMGKEELKSIVYKGSRSYLADEKTPVESEAARFMAELANEYSPENPLYIVAIGAITNVASAILMNPAMKENCVFVWLGGKAHCFDGREFNMYQDLAGARVLFLCGAPVVQLPCMGVVDKFHTSRYDLEHYLLGKNKLCDYLVNYTVRDTEAYFPGKPWHRVIWDVTAVAWLLNDNDRFMLSDIVHAPIPEYDGRYAPASDTPFMNYVYHIMVDELMADLFETLAR